MKPVIVWKKPARLLLELEDVILVRKKITREEYRVVKLQLRDLNLLYKVCSRGGGKCVPTGCRLLFNTLVIKALLVKFFLVFQDNEVLEIEPLLNIALLFAFLYFSVTFFENYHQVGCFVRVVATKQVSALPIIV